MGQEEGMIDFNRSLADLVKREMVTQAVALEAAPNPEALRMLLRGIQSDGRGMLSE